MKKSTIKNVLLVGVSATLAATIAIGSTLAYLTLNEPTKSNIFTVGDIDVELREETGIIGEGGEVKENDDGAEYIEVMPGDYLKKEVTVENTGDKPAYVAVTVKLNNALEINNAIDEVYEKKDGYTAADVQAMYDYIFDGWGINYNPRPGAAGVSDARGVIDGTYGLPEHVLKVDFAKTTNGSTVIGATNWFVAGREKAGQYWVDGPAAYDGYYTANMDDYEICYTYYLLLEPGEESTLFNGLRVPAEFNAEQLKMFDGLQINIDAAAIQADNFYGDAIAAFTALKTEMADGVNDQDVGDPLLVHNEDELKAALAVGGDIIVVNDIELSGQVAVSDGVTASIDLNGNTLKGSISVPATASLTVENGSIVNKDSKESGIETTGTLVLNNVNIDSARHAVRVEGGNVTINGGEYKITSSSSGSTQHAVNVSDGGNVTINGGTFIGPRGTTADSGSAVTVQTNSTATINGGNFSGGKNNTLSAKGTLTVKGGTFDQDPSAYVANSYIATKNDGTWTVAPKLSSTDDEIAAAIEAGDTTITLAEGTYIIPDSAKGKTLTIIGVGDTVIATQDDGSYEGCDYSLDGSTVVFENITINTDSSTYTGYARLNATYNNCTINGTYTLYGDSTFNNCTFNVSGNVYNIWTWGAPTATFNGCTFNSDGKALLLYGQKNTNLTVNNCVFNDNGGLTDLKAAIEIGNDYNMSYTLTVNNTTVNGYEINDKGINTGTTLWANKNSMGTDKLNVVVDGVDVY